jgi:hypothetical protein
MTYTKLDTGDTPVGTGAFLGLGESLLGDGLGAWASERRGAPDLAFPTWS